MVFVVANTKQKIDLAVKWMRSMSLWSIWSHFCQHKYSTISKKKNRIFFKRNDQFFVDLSNKKK